MSDKEKITEILKDYTQKHNISASSVILEEYADELVKQGVTMSDNKQEKIENYTRKIAVYEKTVENLTVEKITANEVIDKIEAENISLRAEIKKLKSMNRDLKVDTCNIEEQLKDVTEKFICQQTVYNDLSNIIKEKNAEIDRLKNENEILSLNADNAFQDGMNEAQDLYAEQVKAEVKSEAIKEYKEKLKEHAYLDSGITGFQEMVVDLSDIENIADEMVGEDK